MTTAVVTGAAGFLGRHLIEHLAGDGIMVIPVSRCKRPGFVQVDDYRQSPQGDVVIHLAEESDRGVVNGYGDEYVDCAAEVVASLVRWPNQLMIYASTGAVYDAEMSTPCKVSSPVREVDTYSKSKLRNERIVLGMGGCVVRLSNLFGVGMSSNNVMSDILRQISANGPLRVRDDTPIRDFLHVSDAACALASLSKGRYTGIFNVGSGVGTSIRELAEMALACTGKSHREVIAGSPSWRVSSNILDISETTRMLGWRPQSSLQEQLTELINNQVFFSNE